MKNLEKAIESLKEISTVLESGVTKTNPLYTVNVKSGDGEHQVYINREERLEALMDIALNELETVIELLEGGESK